MEETIKKLLQYVTSVNPRFEFWWPIKNYPNYQVSSFGRVKNVRTKKLIKPSPGNHGYFRVNLYNKCIKKQLLVHQIVATTFLPTSNNKPYVDHIDRNHKNNHISNLRFATSQENGRNKSKQSNNKSGFAGVSWSSRRKKWEVRIGVGWKHLFVGYFDDINVAVERRRRAVRIHFGQFGCTE